LLSSNAASLAQKAESCRLPANKLDNVRALSEADQEFVAAVADSPQSGASIQVSCDNIKVIKGSISAGTQLLDQPTGSVKSLCLSGGATLFAPDHAIKVETPYGTVQIASRAIVLAVLTKNGLSLYNIHDEHRGDVCFAGKAASLSLPIAQHLMISTEDREFADVNPLDFITHRELRSDKLPGGLQMIHSQFSLLSAINGVAPLRAMLHSSEPGEHKMINRLVKDAAVIMQTSAAASAYRRISASHQTRA
jgi:hypothetical protein